MQLTQIQPLKKILASLYTPNGAERVGFITKDNHIVEVKNVAKDPTQGFMISAEDIIEYTEVKGCWASWHTHPNEDSNLSGEDYLTFKAYPKIIHLIVGNDGVRAFMWNEIKKAIVEVE